ncbi:MAG: PaaI family thioesterase [Gemmatimonadetes bacterium]|nr:PaaI family thioesterase [Gemmatimonadota bacterium]
MILNPKYLEELYRTVNASPFVSHLPMRLAEVRIDGARVELEVARCHIQPFGIVHGGVIATLVDTATFWAGFGGLADGVGLVNVDLKLNYLESVTDGRLVAEGRLVRGGRSVVYAEATILDDRARLVARGASTMMVLPGKGIRLGVAKFV